MKHPLMIWLRHDLPYGMIWLCHDLLLRNIDVHQQQFFFEVFCLIVPAIANRMKHIAFTATTLAPVGVSKTYAPTKPTIKLSVDTAAEHITTPRKLRKKRMAVSDGNMSSDEIRIAPIRRIPTTIVTAVRIETTVL